MARCEGDNLIVLLEPQPVAQVSCVNGHLPVKVQSLQEPCQFHYECECEAWGPGAARGQCWAAHRGHRVCWGQKRGSRACFPGS